MKRIVWFLLAVFVIWIVRGAVGLQSPTVQVFVSDFTLDYTPESRSVTITPHTGEAGKTGTSDSDGQVHFVNVTPGLWQLRIAGVGLPDYTLEVPNASGTLNATNLIISDWTPPLEVPFVNTNLAELTKRLSISDDTLKLDGSPITGGGESVWTNESGFTHPVVLTNQVLIGATSSQVITPFRVATDITNDSMVGVSFEFTPLAGDGSNRNGLVSLFNNGDGLGAFSSAGYFDNSCLSSNDHALYFASVPYGLTAQATGFGVDAIGQAAAVMAVADGMRSQGYGVAGLADSSGGQLTNVAVAGSADDRGTVAVGGYFELGQGYDTADDPIMETAVLLLDVRTNTAAPLIVGRTNNSITVFKVDGNGSLTASSADVGEVVSAQLSFATDIGPYITGSKAGARDTFFLGLPDMAGSTQNHQRIQPAPMTTGNGIDLELYAGTTAASGDGGDVTITASDGSGSDGGSVTIDAGSPNGGIALNAGSGSGIFLSGPVDTFGIMTAHDGIGSTATDAAVSIASTGWTNTNSINFVAYFDGTTMTYTIFNGAGTSVYTNAVALTGGTTAILQPSGKVIISGTGVTGRATPF